MYRILIRLQKKILICIAIGIFFAIFLGFGMGWMEEFQKEVAYKEYQYNTGSYIAYFSGNLDEQDINIIVNDNHISQCGIVTYYKKIYEGKGKDIWIRGANENYMLRNSIVVKGRLPEKENEIIAEQWVLEAIGLEAKNGQEITFSLEDEEGKQSTETFIVSGVLENSAYSKENGLTNIFVRYDLQRDRYPIVNLDIKEKEDLLESLEDIKGKLISTDSFYEYSSEAGAMRQQQYTLTGEQLGKCIFSAFLLLFYLLCIFRLFEEQYMQNIAKMRMCGFSTRYILAVYYKMVLGLYVVFSLLGLTAGKVCMAFLSKAARLDQIHFIFWGRQVSIQPKTVMPMVLCIFLFTFVAVLLFLIWVSFKSMRGTILVQLRYGERAERKSCRMRKGKLHYKTEWISIILFILAQVLCLSVSYQQLANERKAEYETFSQCRNGDFQILGYQSENISNGATREQLEEVKKLPGTIAVETAMVLPVRVKIEDGLQVADDYYKMYNAYAKDTYYREFIGEEKAGGDIVYKSSLMGYNDAALRKLSDYIIEGSINIEKMRHSNTAVLFVPQYVEGRYRQRFYKNADRVMDYNVGDLITVKIRDQYTEDMEQYWSMEDHTGSHEEVFEVGAIVYYPYLPNTSVMGLVNPDIIISSDRMSQLTGQQICRVVNIQIDHRCNAQKYIRELNNIFSSVGGITVNDFISKRMEQQMRNRIYAVIGILWSLLVGTGFMACAVIGVKHHILQRKKDLALCRMIGFSKKLLQTDARREAGIYFLWISMLALAGTFVLQYIIFLRSGMQVMGLAFWGREYQKAIFIFINFIILYILFYRNTSLMLRGEMISQYREE
ncbi:MAG: hypothetical protein K1W16_13260 [Lachnospiraceae bacterium]